MICESSFLILVINILNQRLEIKILSNKINLKNIYNITNIYSIYGSLNDKNISKKKVLIFEPFLYHYECTPGFSKYFIDLGYNVDIIMRNAGLSSFAFFKDINKIRFFIYNDIKDIIKYSKYISFSINKYDYVLIETANKYSFSLYKSLNILNINHSIFVFHHLDYLKGLSPYIKLNKMQAWSLGNFENWTQVNPHYFGNICIRKKNRITRFFIISTIKRNYEYLISAAEIIKAENLEFQVIVVGKWNTFTEKNISEKIKENFTFKYNISYSELYNEVNNSDFIIINLDPNNKQNNDFKTNRVTGSAQLAYGFLKPVIINAKFARIYYFNKENSFIYENSNFTDTIRNAINMKNEQYQKMKENLSKLEDYIYKISLRNVNICINHL